MKYARKIRVRPIALLEKLIPEDDNYKDKSKEAHKIKVDEYSS